MPSPRVQAVIDTGEWDTDHKLKLIFVDFESSCWGILLEVSAVAGGPTYTRFCMTEGCDTSSHKKQKVPMSQRSTGWFLEAGGNTRAGAILEISFGVSPDGPIIHSAAPQLVGNSAIKLTHGQWKWLHANWETQNVQEFGDESPMAEDADLYNFEEAADESKEDIAGQCNAACIAITNAGSTTVPKASDQPTMSEEDAQLIIMALVKETLQNMIQNYESSSKRFVRKVPTARKSSWSNLQCCDKPIRPFCKFWIITRPKFII